MRAVFVLALLCGLPATPAATRAYVSHDIPDGHWASDALAYLIEREVLELGFNAYGGSRIITHSQFLRGMDGFIDYLAVRGYIRDTEAAKAEVHAALEEAVLHSAEDAVPLGDGQSTPQLAAVSAYDDPPAHHHWAWNALSFLQERGVIYDYACGPLPQDGELTIADFERGISQLINALAAGGYLADPVRAKAEVRAALEAAIMFSEVDDPLEG